MKRNCDYCGAEYIADSRNLKRGWGLCCSKSCAAHKREKARPDYDPIKVEINNRIREGLVDGIECWDDGDSEYWDTKDF